MSGFLTGLVFLFVGVGVYVYNTEVHTGQVIFPGMTPDQTAATLLGLGIFFTALGGFRWLRTRGAAAELAAYGDDGPSTGEGT
jgi:hypothetical protein